MPRTKKTSFQPAAERIIIEHLGPEINGGLFPIKRVPGEMITVKADIYADGHDNVNAFLLYRQQGQKLWQKTIMSTSGNDRWEGCFVVIQEADYEYTVQAWVNDFETWQKDFRKKIDAQQDVTIDILKGLEHLAEMAKAGPVQSIQEIRTLLKSIGQTADQQRKIELLLSENLLVLSRQVPNKASLVEYKKILKVNVDRIKALFSSWYEFFPRSFGQSGEHGTLKSCAEALPEIARMGFDVVYLPPIHPIGKTNRKGKNNTRVGTSDEPGSPWAIGGKEGGHKAIHPKLGTLEDFQMFVKKAGTLGLEVALDLAFQCSPDHPYVQSHPQWFFYRPDGTIQYAENPPKKYEDVYPINFYCPNPAPLWQELKSVVVFWVELGVKIFRVDNPHTKPFAFWKWLTNEVRKDYPEVLFLSEAFTRPKVMNQLAKAGFHQSYTYFTWRTTKWDLIQYVTELTQTESREYFRPNFWPNTPDILPYHLQNGGRPAFISRLALAATLSSNYGIYGPAYELCVKEAVAGKEEYFDSEKYEIKQWDWNAPGHIKDVITRINQIRKENPALQNPWNTKFCELPNDQLISYYKQTPDFQNIILVVVNLDPYYTQSGLVKVPLWEWDIPYDRPFTVLDLMTRDQYTWQGEWNYIELNPHRLPVHILRVDRL